MGTWSLGVVLITGPSEIPYKSETSESDVADNFRHVQTCSDIFRHPISDILKSTFRHSLAKTSDISDMSNNTVGVLTFPIWDQTMY